jgi:soluble lytic murein transglycosylase-like protein
MIDVPALPINETAVHCIVTAAQRFALPPELIAGVLRTENGRPGQRRPNTDGSRDLGPMQVNTRWIQQFKGFATEAQIANDVCINIHVGAWILRYHQNLSPNFWTAVGNYHSRAPRRNLAYQHKVYSSVLRVRQDPHWNWHLSTLAAKGD